jgi:hypothetical protein
MRRDETNVSVGGLWREHWQMDKKFRIFGEEVATYTGMDFE